MGNPLRWQWIVLLGSSGVVSWGTQEWHSVFPYLIRYNVALLAFMSLVMAPRGRRGLLLLGSMPAGGNPSTVVEPLAVHGGVGTLRLVRAGAVSVAALEAAGFSLV